MPRPEKVQAVEEIRERFDEAQATFVTEYRGLSVAQQQQLRRSVKDADGDYKVFKMSLARRAIEDMDLEGLDELLAGPTALAFAMSDPIPVAKALQDFAKDNERLVIKGGILSGEVLRPEQITRLAEIESRAVLLARIAGGAKAPLVKLAGLLGGKLREAASVFSQLLAKKESELVPAVLDAAEAPPGPAEEPISGEEPTVADEAPSATEPVVEATTDEGEAPPEPAAAEEAPAESEPIREPVVEATTDEGEAPPEPAAAEEAPAESEPIREPAAGEEEEPAPAKNGTEAAAEEPVAETAVDETDEETDAEEE